LVAHQAAGHFVDRQDFLDPQAGVDRLQDPLVILAVEPVIGLNRDDGGAQPTGISHQGAGLDAESRGRVARGDRDGGFGGRLRDDNRLAGQGRGLLLLARRKEGVEVEKQPFHRVLGACSFFVLNEERPRTDKPDSAAALRFPA
jgi:hypothetical protein